MSTSNNSQFSTLNYQLPKGYKQTKVGVIPEDWEIRSLPEITRFRGGKAHEQFISDTGEYVCVNSKFISSEGAVRKYSSANFCPAKTGDILMVMSDLPNGKALAKAFIADQDRCYAVNQRVCALTPYDSTSSGYLFYTLNRHPYFLKFDDGVNQTHLLNYVFAKCPVALPPTKAEQEAIAEALSDADALIESLEQLIAKKRQIKQGAMQELLTPPQGPGQAGKKRLPGFSGEWEVKTLGTVVRIRNERINPQRGQHCDFCIELEHVDQASGLLLGHTETTETSSLKCVFEKGDVLFGKLRSYLRKHWFAMRSGVCSTEIWVLTPEGQKITPSYLYQFVQTDRFIDATSLSFGTHMPRSDWKVVRELEVSLPSPAEQTAIATILSDMDAEIAALETKLAKARQVKQGMMQELLTGRIRLV